MLTNTAEFPTMGAGRRSHLKMPALNPLIPVLIVAAVTFALRATNLIAAGTFTTSVTTMKGTITDFSLRASHGGSYRGEVIAAAPPVGDASQWVVHLEQRNHRRLANANVRVRVWMPETGIESAARPAAAYVGSGNYRLDEVRLTRSGWWNIALIVDGRAGMDSLAFNVRVP